MVFQIRTEIDMDVGIEKVWAALIDIDSWAAWNKWTVFEDVQRPLQSGSKGTLAASYDGDGKWKRFPFAFVKIDEGAHLFNWGGSVGPLFRGNHWIRLSEPSPGRTHVEHHEDMGGLLPALGVGMPYKKVARNYGLINEALKDHLEKSAT